MRQCIPLLRSADRDLYWVCLLLPAAARNGGFVLATLHAELAAIPTRARDPMAALVRWRWWQDGIERICGHDPVAGPYAAHLADSPILQALHTLYADDALDRDLLIGLVEAHEPREDLTDVDAIGQAGTQTAGAMLALIQELILGTRVPAPARVACDAVGAAWTLACMVRRAGEMQVDVPAIHRAASEALARARAQADALSRPSRRGLMLARLADGYLRRAERAGFDLARLPPPAPWRLAALVAASLHGSY